MKRLVVLLVLVAAILSLTGCGKGSITGVVTDSLSNAPLAGVSVAIGSATAKTGTDGKFTISNVEAKSQTITASLEGYKPYQDTVVVEKNKTATKNFAMVANTVPVAKGSLTGTVTESQFKQPLAGVSITIAGVTVTSDSAGKYTITEIAAQSQTISATRDGYSPISSIVTIEENKTAVFNFEMSAGTVTGMISGYVSKYQGSSALEGASVSFGTYGAVTDASGYFRLFAETGTNSDLLITKEGYATTKIQNIVTTGDQILEFEIPVRPLFKPNDLKNAPTITVTGLDAGTTVSGSVNITVTVAGDMPTYAIYSYISTSARSPRTNATFEVDNVTYTVDTTKYENGSNFLRVLVYDINGNAAILLVPFIVSNSPNDVALPGPIPKYDIISYALGVEVGYYSKQQESIRKANTSPAQLSKLADGAPIDLNTVPADTTFYNTVTWTAAANADGYSLYRSFDGKYYTWIGNESSTSYYDYSPLLTPGQKTWYKIEPYNSFGKGPAVVRSIDTMPSYKVFLTSPQNEANEISLTPTFTWNLQASNAFPAGTLIIDIIDIWDSTNFIVHESVLYNQTSYSLPVQLSPGYVYSWDIAGSIAYKRVTDAYGSATSYSIAGGLNILNGQEFGFPGSVNGEFYFTTIVPAE